MLDQRVRKYAQQIQDERLLRKLSVGDMIARGALYHSRCLATLYNKGDREKNNTAIDQCQKEELESIRDATLDEVISYVAKAKYDNPGEPGNRRDVQIDKTARYLQS